MSWRCRKWSGRGPITGWHRREWARSRYGLVMAPARQFRGHQFGNAGTGAGADHASYRARAVVKTCEARRMQRVDFKPRLPLHLYNVHLGTAILERRHQASGDDIVCDRHVTDRSSAGRFQRVDERLATSAQRKLRSVDLGSFLPRKRTSGTYPGLFPCCISITLLRGGK